jgi:hypothetical protein
MDYQQVVRDLPDLIKLSCEFAFEYLSDMTNNSGNDDSNNNNNDTTISTYIFNMLDKLSLLINAKQQGVVQEMRAGLLSLVGFIELRRRSYEEAVKYLKESIALYDDMQARKVSIDMRSASLARANLAQVLCMLGDIGIIIILVIIVIIIIIVSLSLEEGIREYTIVINEESTRLHPKHPSLFFKLLNAGICIQSLSEKRLTVEFLSRAASIADENTDLFTNDQRSNVKNLLQQMI